jgi:hypothetical protein
MTPTEFFASKGWSRLQAEGVMKSCGYRPWGEDGQATEWRANHLYDWCSARGYDHRTAEGQLSFLDYDLRNNLSSIGAKLRKAQTVEEAKAAMHAYVVRLRDPSTRLTPA